MNFAHTELKCFDHEPTVDLGVFPLTICLPSILILQSPEENVVLNFLQGLYVDSERPLSEQVCRVQEREICGGGAM